jgi:hypothetical protein
MPARTDRGGVEHEVGIISSVISHALESDMAVSSRLERHVACEIRVTMPNVSSRSGDD